MKRMLEQRQVVKGTLVYAAGNLWREGTKIKEPRS